MRVKAIPVKRSGERTTRRVQRKQMFRAEEQLRRVFDRSPRKTARGAPNIIDEPIRIRK